MTVQSLSASFFSNSTAAFSLLSRFSVGACRHQRERVLDAPSRGQPQQDLRVPGALLPLQGLAHFTRFDFTSLTPRHYFRPNSLLPRVKTTRPVSVQPQDGYFNEEAKYNLCYCESCHKLRGDEAYYKRGEPPRDYALPFGWCRFALRWEAAKKPFV